MRDLFDDTLAEGGRFLRQDDDLDAALATLTAARADEARAATKPARSRPRLFPVLAIATAFAVAGGGAVAASQWSLWTYVPDPDLVVARDWVDVAGNYLGSCESHLSTDTLPADARELAVAYLDSVDVDSIEPDPEWIAGELQAVGRLDDIGTLVDGAKPADFDTGGEGWSGPALEYFSDARILQDALTQKVFTGMSDVLVERMPDFSYDVEDIGARIETQCTTDPGRTGQQ